MLLRSLLPLLSYSLAPSQVLTSAAYKMAVGRQLPSVSYLTFVDKYMLSCALYVILVAVQSRVLHIVTWQQGDMEEFDKVCRTVLGIIWVIGHMVFFSAAYYLRRYPRTDGISAPRSKPALQTRESTSTSMSA